MLKRLLLFEEASEEACTSEAASPSIAKARLLGHRVSALWIPSCPESPGLCESACTAKQQLHLRKFKLSLRLRKWDDAKHWAQLGEKNGNAKAGHDV